MHDILQRNPYYLHYEANFRELILRMYNHHVLDGVDDRYAEYELLVESKDPAILALVKTLK